MGRHGNKGSSRVPLMAAAAIIALGGASAVGWAALNTGDDDTAQTSSSSTTSTTPTSEAAAPSPSEDAETTTADTTEDTAAAEAKAALESCRTTVKAYDAYAKAVDGSAGSWAMHTQAQVKLDEGEYTVAQTKADWATSKKNINRDLKAFAAATKAKKAAAGGCDSAKDTSGTDSAGAATACLDRLAALEDVAAKGKRVHEQWATHIDMMAHKEHSSGAAYHRRWLNMVKVATPALADYAKADKALTSAPSCA